MEIRDIKRITPNKLRGVYAGCTNGKPTVWTSESVQFSQVADKLEASRLCNELNDGLYHFPVSEGDVVFLVESCLSTLVHISTLVGKSGQVRAVVNPQNIGEEAVRWLIRTYPNLWIYRDFTDGYNPFIELQVLSDHRQVLLRSCYQDKTRHPGCALPVIKPIREKVLLEIFSFLGTFPLTPITTLICRHPRAFPPVSADSLVSYEQYLMRNVQPICSLYISGKGGTLPASAFWVMMSVPIASGLIGDTASSSFGAPANSEDSIDFDFCCERILDILSSTKGGLPKIPKPDIRPKEQLRLETPEFQNVIILIARYRKTRSVSRRASAIEENVASTVPIAPTFVFDEETVQAFASTISQLVNGDVPRAPLSEIEVREAAANVLNAYNTKALSGPMARTLSGIANDLVGNPNPSNQETLSGMLDSLIPPTPSSLGAVDPHLMFELQQQAARRRHQ